MNDLKTRFEERQRLLDEVRRILVDDLKIDQHREHIDPDAPLFGTGLALDSVDAMELVVAVESRFGLRLDDSMGQPHFFRTVNSVVDVVLARRGSTP